MKDLEKQVEQYALSNTGLKENFDRVEEEYYQREKVQVYDMLKEAIKSDVSKEYWQKGMYSEEETEILCLRAMRDVLKCMNGKLSDFDQDTWFIKNKKK